MLGYCYDNNTCVWVLLVRRAHVLVCCFEDVTCVRHMSMVGGWIYNN